MHHSGSIFCALGLICAAPQSASAQQQSSRLTLQGPAQQSTSIVRDVLGRACLDVEAAARGHVANPNMLDHVVSIKNNCALRINVKICYAKTEICKTNEISGHMRLDVILGTQMNMKFFQYQITQTVKPS